MEKYVLVAIFAEGDELKVSAPTVEKNKLEHVIKSLKAQHVFENDELEIRRV